MRLWGKLVCVKMGQCIQWCFRARTRSCFRENEGKKILSATARQCWSFVHQLFIFWKKQGVYIWHISVPSENISMVAPPPALVALFVLERSFLTLLHPSKTAFYFSPICPYCKIHFASKPASRLPTKSFLRICKKCPVWWVWNEGMGGVHT